MNYTVIKSILQNLAAKSFETERHTGNMQKLALDIGRELGPPPAGGCLVARFPWFGLVKFY